MEYSPSLSRINGKTMTSVAKRYEGFPTWYDGPVVVLARIDADNVVPSNRPVALAGKNSLANQL